METILILGAETVVGANIAAASADRYRVLTISDAADIRITGCTPIPTHGQESAAIASLVRAERPHRIIHCGAAARSVWANPQVENTNPLSDVKFWAELANELDAPLTLVSTDAVFSGPWMFHDEQCTGLCDSPSAEQLRQIEQTAADTARECLIVRTHAIGWSVPGGEEGWVEFCLRTLQDNQPHDFDYIRHATPILATDLAEALIVAHQEGLTGTYHIAGAERVNPAQLAAKLAREFDYDEPQPATRESLSRRPDGFARGETSLQTRKIRAAVGFVAPLLNESLRKLREQAENGYRDLLNPSPSLAIEGAA